MATRAATTNNAKNLQCIFVQLNVHQLIINEYCCLDWARMEYLYLVCRVISHVQIHCSNHGRPFDIVKVCCWKSPSLPWNFEEIVSRGFFPIQFQTWPTKLRMHCNSLSWFAYHFNWTGKGFSPLRCGEKLISMQTF